MVRQAISRFEKSIKHTALLRKDPERYFNDAFNGAVELYVGINRRCIERSLQRNMQNGQEDDKLFATMLAYVPDLELTAQRHPYYFNRRPELLPFSRQVADGHPEPLEQRIFQLASEAPDGAVVWDQHGFNNHYVIWGDIFGPATQATNILTGRREDFIDDAIKPLITESLPDNHIGARTLKAACVPLAIPGAVSFVLKGTVYKYGVGKVIMFDGRGTRREAFIDGGDDKLKTMKIVTQEYRWDDAQKRTVKAGAHDYVMTAKQLGVRWEYLRKSESNGYAPLP